MAATENNKKTLDFAPYTKSPYIINSSKPADTGVIICTMLSLSFLITLMSAVSPGMDLVYPAVILAAVLMFLSEIFPMRMNVPQ